MCHCSDAFDAAAAPPDGNAIKFARGKPYEHDANHTLGRELDGLSNDLRSLSLKIHKRPEIAFKEVFAHDTLTGYLENQDFQVTRHACGLDTAWKAVFQHGHDGPVIGINSEMDALPGLGHACGHNLIAIAGVGTAVALSRALRQYDVPGKIVLLGTPAEEGGGGKIIMLKAGAYKEMDVCMMTHPVREAGFGAMFARNMGTYDFHGYPAHAALSPHQGINALDACVIAYNSISMLRQQIQPNTRIHVSIATDADHVINVIAAHATLRVAIRATDMAEFERVTEAVKTCAKAAAASAGCKYNEKWDAPYLPLENNLALANEYALQMETIGEEIPWRSLPTASTDFGNVSQVVPSIHPLFEIPTTPDGQNHTLKFTESAASAEAHDACVKAMKGLASVGWRVLTDATFLHDIRQSFERERQQSPNKIEEKLLRR